MHMAGLDDQRTYMPAREISKVSILIHVKQAPQPQSDSFVVGASALSPEGAKNHQFESH